VVEPARPEPGYWAGAPTALVDGADTWLAYRERDPHRRGSGVVLARSHAGAAFDPVVVLDQERFGAESLERPALTRTGDGRWRLYVSCATPGSKHWRIELLEANAPDELGRSDGRTVLPGVARRRRAHAAAGRLGRARRPRHRRPAARRLLRRPREQGGELPRADRRRRGHRERRPGHLTSARAVRRPDRRRALLSTPSPSPTAGCGCSTKRRGRTARASCAPGRSPPGRAGRPAAGRPARRGAREPRAD
jgi:hypothetical protein